MAGLRIPRNMPAWSQQAQSYLSQAGGTYGAMGELREGTTIRETPAPQKTVGGGLMSAASMGMAGASMAASGMLGGTAAVKGGAAATGAMGMAGPIGWAAAGVGLLAYLLS